jgi:FdrA protein
LLLAANINQANQGDYPMAHSVIIRKNQYYDSVFLMGVNKRLMDQKGVKQAAVLMGTEPNKKQMAELGIADPRMETASPNDLVVLIIADTQEIADDVGNRFDSFLESSSSGRVESNLHQLKDGLAAKPGANLAVISVPGVYAARETRKALEAGLHVFLFSDNVTIEEELDLKKFAAEKRLLLMGPDCGTSILAGKGIGFANVVRKGRIGVAGPSGTGIQEFTSQVHNAGYGISHAIGTGSRDLSDAIGGLSTIDAVRRLEADDHTGVIAVISKPPGQNTLLKLADVFQECSKPVVACFLGIAPNALPVSSPFFAARTIDEAVREAIRIAYNDAVIPTGVDWNVLLKKERAGKTRDQVYLRGLFAGGTFCYQSQHILRDAGIPVYSNTPLEKKFKLDNPNVSCQHTLIDMGDDFYTRGTPHPMIDGTLRYKRILSEGKDPQVSVIYLDFVLGYNASMDPAGELLSAIQKAKQQAAERGGYLSVIANICGTNADPQNMKLQAKLLEEAGVVVFYSNTQATLFCKELLAASSGENL